MEILTTCCNIFLLKSLSDGILDFLWKKVKNPNEHQVYRKAAVCYMASFIVRAKYISIRLVIPSLMLNITNAVHFITKAHRCEASRGVRRTRSITSTAIIQCVRFNSSSRDLSWFHPTHIPNTQKRKSPPFKIKLTSDI